MRWKKFFIIIPLTVALFYAGCIQTGADKTTEPAEMAGKTVSNLAKIGLEKLSEYGFFKGRMADLIPVDGIIPYDINTPLFSDFAHKARFVKVPEGKQAQYEPLSTLDFPVGTILIKNFFYPNDFRDESKGRKIIETRLLIHKEKGWKGLPYIWNDEQTEAYLEVAGGKKDISWVHYDGTKKDLSYSVPNMNQCKGCHIKGSEMKPIGPKARQLNKTFPYADGTENQLLKWQEAGILAGLPEKLEDCPKVPVWDDPESGTLEERARAYLEINCAHCHNPQGPANTSGLFLDYYHRITTNLGIYKTPVAAGRGSGDLKYDIVPGKPDQSIILYRMKSTDPGVMMPELGRKMVHKEGVKLVADWIASLDPQDYQ